ncbi:PH domain-containing protein [Geodermatophilus sp. DSM 44513]|uniref:PH domain-containing protein n=1 Tax=Geodermatophilus sp. DSM 44513 TaxID=1528104 RepID=UPI00127D4CCC|nr:PH domain-containing protein [Geodermatophilus sp. DSM 44513]WNV75695.1 PH domain-containing protein [Geodermatophilus sp. DSM 44513]
MQWSPPAGQTAVLAVAGLLLAGAAVLLDPLGRVLVGGAAVLLLGLAARDRLLRPRLSAGPTGVAVRRLGGRTELPWARLQVRVRDTRRLGLRSRLLELDTAAGPDDDGGQLVVLGRLDLGADPAEVARLLLALDPAAD